MWSRLCPREVRPLSVRDVCPARLAPDPVFTRHNGLSRKTLPRRAGRPPAVRGAKVPRPAVLRLGPADHHQASGPGRRWLLIRRPGGRPVESPVRAADRLTGRLVRARSIPGPARKDRAQWTGRSYLVTENLVIVRPWPPDQISKPAWTAHSRADAVTAPSCSAATMNGASRSVADVAG